MKGLPLILPLLTLMSMRYSPVARVVKETLSVLWPVGGEGSTT